jgi:hypothetical protein
MASSANLISVNYDLNTQRISLIVSLDVQSSKTNVSMIFDEQQILDAAILAQRATWMAADCATVASAELGMTVIAPEGT